MWWRLRRRFSQLEGDVFKIVDGVVGGSRRRRRQRDTISFATTSSAYSTAYSSVEQVILALAEDIGYTPESLSEERIAHSLKRIAQGHAPQYHSKMRICDVEELERYRKKLVARLQQKEAHTKELRNEALLLLDRQDALQTASSKGLVVQRNVDDKDQIATAFSSMQFLGLFFPAFFLKT